MKLIRGVIVSGLIFVSSTAFSAEISTVIGSPDPSLDFVQKLVTQRVSIGDPSGYEQDSSTWVYSVFSRKGVHSAVAVQVLRPDGISSIDLFTTGLQVGSALSPVVYTNVGPIEDSICNKLEASPQTAYVVVSGNDSEELGSAPHCFSKNILFVAAFDQEHGDLTRFANWGKYVRIAAPSFQIRATQPGGREVRLTNTTLGSSLVAAHLAIYARNHPEARGGELVDQFLKDETIHEPILEGKIDGGRLLKDTDLLPRGLF